MKVLVVGAGAREHALAWRLAADRAVSEVIVAPRNVGIVQTAERSSDTRMRSIPIAIDRNDEIFALAEGERIDLTVVGPEQPLERGLVDLFTSRGRLIFGPSRGAAALETSKVFAKTFMQRHGIPTARSIACDDPQRALATAESGELGWPVVVKADGLAAGKGVVIASDRRGARDAVSAAMIDRRFGTAGARVVLEEYMHGVEASFFVICDGTHALPLPSAQDHKRAYDDDRGPNTGGMGAFAPSRHVTPEIANRVMREIVQPVLDGMRADGLEYRGFLYAGLMLTSDGPKVVEFNVRFGDPEAQVVLPLIDDELAPVLAAAADGTLGNRSCRSSSDVAVGVVLASSGYPGDVRTGLPIEGLDAAAALKDVLVFHAGTAERAGQVVTSGGRVLTVVGRGATYDAAIARAYDGVSAISFEQMHFRSDIGKKALTSPNA
ncbi:MAG TPA: phosphoribosylamine--glycine ligase [Vicinamibacterales bacterium]|jgi:phosphoribosylamine--glycine ligase|nr:phosphoribosylamine--glycine ligase [Vicinamibacterales bacterium]